MKATEQHISCGAVVFEVFYTHFHYCFNLFSLGSEIFEILFI